MLRISRPYTKLTKENHMNFTGAAFNTSVLEQSEQGDFIRVDFDLQNSPVNVFNDAIFDELNELLDQIESQSDIAGLVFTSSKGVFVAGADIPILLDAAIHKSKAEVQEILSYGHRTFDRIQALNIPTAAAINGFALGGGLEFTLAMDVRVMAKEAKVGLPEVNLGIFPGWGGTTRLPRIIAPEIAATWIATGRPQNADAALNAGLIAKISSQEELIAESLEQLKAVQDRYAELRSTKSQAVSLSDESRQAIDDLLVGLQKRPGVHYPAGTAAVNSLLSQASKNLADANKVELNDFSEVIKTDTAINLLSVFLNEQTAARAAKKYAKGADQTQSAAVIGAGIMGGGIAYQSALKNIPTVMKDINQNALDLGMEEADRNFSTLVKKGKMDETKKQAALDRIKPTLENEDIADVDVIVEAVVENINVKKSVIAELEDQVAEDTIISSNTSTISITRIAEDLKRPENFCGMHFFNPVPVMPLVEIIRGEKTSDQTISNIVSYAMQLGKNAVVVNDCPGFLVNRVLFPYINAAHIMINEGVDFQQLDTVMQAWGWPMGPAYLSDVIGIDTMVHCLDVMATDIPERMALDFDSANHVMFKNNRLGQKNGIGFYQYARNETGRMAKQVDEASIGLLYSDTPKQIDPKEIEERMMLGICLEMVRCLEEGIVDSPAEADMALLWGLGFPRFRGGAIRHIDTIGVEQFCQIVEKYEHLAEIYKMPSLLAEKRANKEAFYV